MAESSDTLYIRIGRESFLFARYNILNKQRLEYVDFKLKPDVSLNANMHEALKRVPFAMEGYRNVRVLVEGTATLVPLNEFEEENCEQLFFFNAPARHKRRRVFYDTLPHMGAVLLFGADKDMCHTLEETYENIYFQSTETPLLLHFASCSPRVLSRGRLFVALTPERVSVAAFRSGKIELYNTFALDTLKDALYYVLSMAKLWNMNPAVDEIFVAGMENEARQLAEDTKIYYPNCFYNDPNDEFGKVGSILKEVIPYDMMNALLKAY